MVPNSRYKLKIVKHIFHKENKVFLYCASYKVFNLMFALHIVNSLVIIDFLLVESTSQISLTQKIANVSNLQ